MSLHSTRALLFTLALLTPSAARAQTLMELDAYWAETVRAVEAGDADGYRAMYHPDAVLVADGATQLTRPIVEQFERWAEGLRDTREGRASVSLAFRFTRRIHDATTAHETGIFRYSSQEGDQPEEVALVHFEALLVKKDGRWLALMEFQKGEATEEEWAAAGG